jgi:hypothetical protein
MATIRALLNLSRYPALLVFVAMGACATLFAWSSFNLFHLAMANISFLQAHGIMGIMDGGFRQLAGLVFQGAVALLCYLGFKACEVELVNRWRGGGD